MAKDISGVSPEQIASFMTGETLQDYVEIAERVKSGVEEQTRLARAIEHGTTKQLATALEALFADKPELKESPRIDVLKAVAKPKHRQMPLLDACIAADVPAYLHGEAGSGKSTAAEHAAATRGMTLRALSLNPMTSKSDIVGYNDANGKYNPSGFREVYENGGIFLFDEMDNGNASVVALVNRALSGWQNEFPDRPVDRNWNTRIIAAANTIGKGATAQYVGRNALDAATLDRFAMIPWDIDEHLEDLLMKVTKDDKEAKLVDISEGGIPTRKEWLDAVRGYRSRAEANRMRVVISPRSSIYGAKLAEQGVGMRWLSEMLILKGTAESDRRKLEAPKERKSGKKTDWSDD